MDDAGVSGRDIIVAVDPKHNDGGKGVGEQATEVPPEQTPIAPPVPQGDSAFVETGPYGTVGPDWTDSSEA